MTVNNHCGTCLHEELSSDQEPCNTCRNSNWEPFIDRNCDSCLHRHRPETVEPCASCGHTRWEKKNG